MNNVLVVGDLHGDWGKLNALISRKHPEIIFQTGDFGWWPQCSIKPVLYRFQKEWKLHGIKSETTKVFWCDGNHENHWELEKLVKDNGKRPIKLYNEIYYMPRGAYITLPDGRAVLFIGGADSVDKRHRTLGIDWYPEEMISNSDLDMALSYNTVDIVISHTCPQEFDINGFSEFNYEKVKDPSRIALSRILEKYKPSLWYFGHWHKEAHGKVGNTNWKALDYPGHGTKWFCKLGEI